MSLDVPTTTEIRDAFIAELETSFSQTIPLLPKAFTRILAATFAGIFVLLWKYGTWMSKQLFIRFASFKETEIDGIMVRPLVELGRELGVSDPTEATAAELVTRITVENQTGSIPAGTQLLNTGNGVTYLMLAAVLLDAATKDVTVRAAADQQGGAGAGTIGNLDATELLSFANPIANVARDTVVQSQSTTGADAESEAAYRQRVLDRKQKTPQGGAYADYEQWGEEVAGIINCYPYTGALSGHVDIYSEATVASSGDPDGIPTAAQLQDVWDAINLNEAGMATQRPAGAFINSYPITRVALAVTVDGITIDAGLLAQLQTDIEAAVEEYFAAKEPYIVGLSIPPRRDFISQLELGGVVSAVVLAAGGTFLGLFIKVGGIDQAAYSLGEGEKAKLDGSVIFT